MSYSVPRVGRRWGAGCHHGVPGSGRLHAGVNQTQNNAQSDGDGERGDGPVCPEHCCGWGGCTTGPPRHRPSSLTGARGQCHPVLPWGMLWRCGSSQEREDGKCHSVTSQCPPPVSQSGERAQNHRRVSCSPSQGPAGCSHGHGGGGSAALSALAANTKSIGHVPAPAGPSAEGSSQGRGRRRGGSARGGGRAVPSQSPPRRCLCPVGAVPGGGAGAALTPSMLAVVAGLWAAGVQSAAVLTEGESSRLWPMEAEGWGRKGDRHGDSEVMRR